MPTILRVATLILAVTSALAQQQISPVDSSSPATMPASTSRSSQAISRARQMIATNPGDAGAYAALGTALCHQAEETSNAALYVDADRSLDKALQISPDNFEAKKAQVCIELGRHEFARAREQAMILNKRIPDDIMVYGLLVDANSALGNYADAEDAAQWMLKLRPGNTPALLHAADLREVFGQQDGALQLLRVILDASSPGDVSGRTAVLTQMARVELEIGDLSSTQAMGEAALSLQPDDSRALFVMAKLRLLQGRPAEAVELIRRSYKSVPQTQTLYALGDALEKAGLQNEAKKAFAEFEQEAVAESSHAYNANRDLIFYYADNANNPAKSLTIAELEIAQRHDVYTLDAYAWALSKNGRYADAKKQMDTALRIGIREATVFYHAGEIELGLGNTSEARRLFNAAVELKSIRSHDANIALASLQPELKPAK
jgi:tetratricopeptide (TPR) repeat protein